MPAALTYPGVYVEEISSGVRTITGVATSVTAFIGRALRGPCDDEGPVTINNYGDFERIFGGLWVESSLGYAVRDFYLNGGSKAVIVRLYHPRFKDEDKARSAAEQVANEAKTGLNGADAKVKSKAKFDEIKKAFDAVPPTVTQEEKDAAEQVNIIISRIADNLTKNDVENVAQSAIKIAVPFQKAKLSAGLFALEAAYPGKWGVNLRASVEIIDNLPESTARNLGVSKNDLFNLTVRDIRTGYTEKHLNLSYKENSVRRIDKVLEAESRLVRWDKESPLPASENTFTEARKLATSSFKKMLEEAIKKVDDAKKVLDDARNANPPVPADTIRAAQQKVYDLIENKELICKLFYDDVGVAEEKLARAKPETSEVAELKTALEKALRERDEHVSDGTYLEKKDFTPDQGQAEKKGMYALEYLFARDGLFNLLCIPPYLAATNNIDIDISLVSEAAAYCESRRAMLLVDPPRNWKDKERALQEFTGTEEKVGTRSRNAALFFPRLKQPNPLRDNQMEEFAPCGAVAGIFARTDTQRGVWKAPAGIDATLKGVPELSVKLTDAENGELNPLGINCLRTFPAAGRVVWGARTLRGNDQLADEWKYIPVRRTALFIEESLYRGTQWVVFEPNDEPLWAQIRLNVGAFMHNLFRQGAFQGSTPKDAYFVKCNKETNPQNDIDRGIVNIMVGFAPLKPAEFVVIKLQQIAGQIEF